MRHVRRWVLPVFCVALLGGTAQPAAAATGSIGIWEAHSFCGGNQLTMYNPAIDSSYGSAPPGTSTAGSQHNQWVAWRASLYYATDNVNWNLSVAPSSWRIGFVGDSVASPISGATSWYDSGTGQWNAAAPSWTLSSHGYFGVVVEVYWYADAQAAAGSDVRWATVFDSLLTQGYSCSY